MKSSCNAWSITFCEIFSSWRSFYLMISSSYIYTIDSRIRAVSSIVYSPAFSDTIISDVNAVKYASSVLQTGRSFCA